MFFRLLILIRKKEHKIKFVNTNDKSSYFTNKFDLFFVCIHQQTHTENFEMGFLCREQIIKGLYLAIGSKHGLPKDLLLIIYRLTKDDSSVRDYHTDAIYRNTIVNYSGAEPLPQGRGLEWAIKWASTRSNRSAAKAAGRTFILTQLCIFGEKDYLLERCYLDDGDFQSYLKRPSNQLKLRYLNNTSQKYIVDDYLTYLFVDRDPSGRICLDAYGDALWDQPQPDEIFIDS
jgi:hypothetical protein